MAKKTISRFGALSSVFNAIALTLSSSAFSADISIPPQLVNNPRISTISVSPGGDYVAYVAPVENTDVLIVAKHSDLTPLFTTQLGSDRYVGQISWANDERFLLWPVKAYGKYKDKRLTGEVQAMNYDGSENLLLWGGANGERKGFMALENRLKQAPEKIIIATQESLTDASSTRILHQMDIYTGRMLPVERSSVPLADFVVANDGEPVLQLGLDENDDTVIAYKDQQGNWQQLADSKNYDDGWVMDEQNIALKVKSDADKLVQFNRLTQKYSVLDISVVSQLEKEQQDQQGMIATHNMPAYTSLYLAARNSNRNGLRQKIPERKLKSLRDSELRQQSNSGD